MRTHFWKKFVHAEKLWCEHARAVLIVLIINHTTYTVSAICTLIQNVCYQEWRQRGSGAFAEKLLQKCIKSDQNFNFSLLASPFGTAGARFLLILRGNCLFQIREQKRVIRVTPPEKRSFFPYFFFLSSYPLPRNQVLAPPSASNPVYYAHWQWGQTPLLSFVRWSLW